MQRIVSLFAALMILFFSVVGEGAHASASECSESAITQKQSVETADTCVGPAAFEKGSSLSEAPQVLHNCHFGHCAFTVFFSQILSSPTPFLDTEVVELYPYLQSGFRSETLRPPSRI